MFETTVAALTKITAITDIRYDATFRLDHHPEGAHRACLIVGRDTLIVVRTTQTEAIEDLADLVTERGL